MFLPLELLQISNKHQISSITPDRDRNRPQLDIHADEKERQAVRTNNSPGKRYDRSSNTQLCGRGFAEPTNCPLIRINSR
jgi:hypothetical protein